MKNYLLVLLIFGFSFNSLAQKDKKAESADNFKIDDLPKLLISELNKFRKGKGLDTLDANDLLFNAASISAEKMADDAKNPKVDPLVTQKNLKKVGGTKKGEEVAASAPVSKGRDNYKTSDVAKTIYTRWESNKKDLAIVLNPKHVLVGISCHTDEAGKKVYVSAVFGSYDITNEGAKMGKELPVAFNKKSKKMQGPDQKSCKNCDKWKNYDNLQKGLSVSDGKIYLTYGNLKDLKRLLKKPKDGFAVDIVQRAQYEKAEYNIMDNNLYNKGVMSKAIYKDKFFSKNRIKPDPKAKKKVKINKIEVEMGKFNSNITGDYELNLIIIQDGHICKTITRSYLENGDQESSSPVGILPAPDTKGLKPPFEPRSESSIINFNIPFAKNKFEYKNEDVQPLVKALNEPDFMIEGLYIYAYSSIEGDSVANAKLQRKRAESVSGVLLGGQAQKVKPNVETRDSWDLFMLENDDGKYADIVAMGKRKAINKINSDRKLVEELEPILARERFAQVIMDVTYDISGNKEQKFSSVSFGRALKADNQKHAAKIMEYIYQKVKEKKYSPGAIDSLEIPADPKFVNMMNNKVHYRFLVNDGVDEDDQAEIERLSKIDPSNEILKYNRLYCAIRVDSSIGNNEAQAKMQQSIDELYKSKIDKKQVDGLNIEWQFKLMEALDTVDSPAAQAAVEACVTRIKSFYNMKDASWQNALKLAFVFSRAKDFSYASALLEPHLNQNADENLVFAYISIASHLPEKFYSRTFAGALTIAKNRNQARYCKLFGNPFMSFQVLENPDIKKVYRESGCK